MILLLTFNRIIIVKYAKKNYNAHIIKIELIELKKKRKKLGPTKFQNEQYRRITTHK